MSLNGHFIFLQIPESVWYEGSLRPPVRNEHRVLKDPRYSNGYVRPTSHSVLLIADMIVVNVFSSMKYQGTMS